jgi:hypothetical protein
MKRTNYSWPFKEVPVQKLKNCKGYFIMFRNASTLTGRIQSVSGFRKTQSGVTFREYTLQQDLPDGAARLVRFRLFGDRCKTLGSSACLGTSVLVKGKITPRGLQVATTFNLGDQIPWAYDRNDGEVDGVVTSIQEDGDHLVLEMKHTRNPQTIYSFKFKIGGDTASDIGRTCKTGDHVLVLGEFDHFLNFKAKHIIPEYLETDNVLTHDPAQLAA